MKELSTEQKAKAYDKALERMKAWVKGEYPECFTEAQKTAEFIFPELKESEDERIKKAIMEFFELQDDNTTYSFIPKKDILTWLEKQGEKKSADKVEPRFHEGEWVANDYCVGKVIALTDDAYLLDTGQGIPFSCEHNAHLWTIEDAKDGDVLVSNDEVFIYSHMKQMYPIAVAHCFIANSGILYFDGEFVYKKEENSIHPATKEQRDLLFSNMEEEGYKWDVDKKELKKIERKSTWSEEDEHRVKDIIYFLDTAKKHYASTVELDACIDWCKSFKERIRV